MAEPQKARALSCGEVEGMGTGELSCNFSRGGWTCVSCQQKAATCHVPQEGLGQAGRASELLLIFAHEWTLL